MSTRIIFLTTFKGDRKILCREERCDFSVQCKSLKFNADAAPPPSLLARNRSFLTHHQEEQRSVAEPSLSPIHAFQINQLPAILLSFLI